MLDWWEKRELERKLAQELMAAEAKFRQANLRLMMLVDDASAAIPAPDSTLLIKQAGDTSKAAFDEWQAALERWKRFVINGTSA
jgi:hypothetical protein